MKASIHTHEFLQLNMLFSKPGEELSPDTIESFERRARQWGRDFIGVYQTKNVTPYIHALMNHVGQFMRIHPTNVEFYWLHC